MSLLYTSPNPPPYSDAALPAYTIGSSGYPSPPRPQPIPLPSLESQTCATRRESKLAPALSLKRHISRGLRKADLLSALGTSNPEVTPFRQDSSVGEVERSNAPITSTRGEMEKDTKAGGVSGLFQATMQVVKAPIAATVTLVKRSSRGAVRCMRQSKGAEIVPFLPQSEQPTPAHRPESSLKRRQARPALRVDTRNLTPTPRQEVLAAVRRDFAAEIQADRRAEVEARWKETYAMWMWC